ncbi:carnitine O-palmitoyltransferase 2, mitochondrial-like [Heterodontus francisci]|uniref:carnitine O-palmitoyltransferase 2, mitochondrial-like n=1 Tax=Heterodontus francisci TaxID=7792 RepID=UPI00355BA494
MPLRSGFWSSVRKRWEQTGKAVTNQPGEVFQCRSNQFSAGSQFKTVQFRKNLDCQAEFTYLGSTITSNLSLDAEISKRLGKASTAMSRLAKRHMSYCCHGTAKFLRSYNCECFNQPQGIRRYKRLLIKTAESSSEMQFLHKSIIPTMHFQDSLPRLPIPKLEDSIRRYLAAQRPLLEEDNYRKTKEIAWNFQKGVGRTLHKELVYLDRKNKNTSYISAHWYNKYLTARKPLVFNTSPFISLHFDAKPEYNNQLVRATNLVISALRFLKTLKSNYLTPDIFHMKPDVSETNTFKRLISLLPSRISWYGAHLASAYPLDMSQYVYLFNTTRIPKLNKDELLTVEQPKHLLVMRNGHFYVFDVLDSCGDILHPSEIQKCLQYILQVDSSPPEFPLGYLTTEDRDTWAKVRQELVDLGNRENLQKVEGAIFCLCLDDVSVENEVELTHTMFHGYGANRWFDKSFSLIITKNGESAINFEHSWGDGVAVLRFLEEIFKDSTTIPAISPKPEPTSSDSSAVVQKLEFKLNESVKAAVNVAQASFEHIRKSLRVGQLEFSKFGKNFIAEQNLSPDAIVQLAFQMAFLHQHGKTVPTYESCSTAAFKHGRTETIRPATVPTKQCSAAFVYERGKHSSEELKNMIHSCSKYHRKLLIEATLGNGFDRHLFAMHCLSEAAGGSRPEFYQDPAYIQFNNIIISTSTLNSSAVKIGGFAPVTQDGYGIAYNIFDTWFGCNLTWYASRDGNEFLKCLNQSLDDIFDVLKGKPLV